MTIDPEGESRALKERSEQLSELLLSSIPVVDRRPIPLLEEESRRLGAKANEARAAVAKRVAQGLPAGVPLGAIPPIRRLPRGRDPDSVLRDRTCITDELLHFWRFRKDQLGPCIVSCYSTVSLPRLPAVVLAAVEGHIAALRQRGTYVDEGLATLEGALARYQSVPELLARGAAEGSAVIAEAEVRLSNLLSEEMAIRTGQGISWQDWATGRLASLLGDPLDLPPLPPAAAALSPDPPVPVSSSPSPSPARRQVVSHR